MSKKQIENEKLGLIVFDSAYDLGQKIDKKLLEMYEMTDDYTFIVPIKQNFF